MAWAATEAKAKFSELLDRVQESGPQIIRRRKQVFYVLTEEQRTQELAGGRERKSKATQKSAGTLGDFFKNSPLAESGLRLERVKFKPRHIDL